MAAREDSRSGLEGTAGVVHRDVVVLRWDCGIEAERNDADPELDDVVADDARRVGVDGRKAGTEVCGVAVVGGGSG